MVKKIFWENPYQDECKAIVTHIEGNKIKLDQTIFFAFSGGQESDSGSINGINVIEAIKLGDKENIIDIEYTLEKIPNFKVGDEVILKIDLEKRKKLMKLHTIAHIAYYIITEKLGKLKIIGSNITSEKARIDFLYDKPLNDIVTELENKLNQYLLEDHHITRKQDEKLSDLQWWICDEWKMPCGGTHVKSTKEIGKIQLKRKNIGAGKERIEIFLS